MQGTQPPRRRATRIGQSVDDACECARNATKAAFAEVTKLQMIVDERQLTCYACGDRARGLQVSDMELLVCGHGVHRACALRASRAHLAWRDEARAYVQHGQPTRPHEPFAIMEALQCGICRTAAPVRLPDTVVPLWHACEVLRALACTTPDTFPPHILHRPPVGTVADVAEARAAIMHAIEQCRTHVHTAWAILHGAYSVDHTPPQDALPRLPSTVRCDEESPR